MLHITLINYIAWTIFLVTWGVKNPVPTTQVGKFKNVWALVTHTWVGQWVSCAQTAIMSASQIVVWPVGRLQVFWTQTA